MKTKTVAPTTTTVTSSRKAEPIRTTTVVVRNAFLGQKATIMDAIRRATSQYGCARILSKKLGVPFQVAYGVSGLSDRSLRRLCNQS